MRYGRITMNDRIAFYQTMAQVIPVLLLALAVELRLENVVFAPKNKRDIQLAKVLSWIVIGAITGSSIAEGMCILVIGSENDPPGWFHPYVVWTTMASVFLIGLFGAAAAANPFSDRAKADRA
jgi:hypothetical protein